MIDRDNRACSKLRLRKGCIGQGDCTRCLVNGQGLMKIAAIWTDFDFEVI